MPGQTERKEAMLIRNRRLFVPLGLLSLVTAVLINRLTGNGGAWSGFFEGVFTGLAFSLALGGLIAERLACNHE